MELREAFIDSESEILMQTLLDTNQSITKDETLLDFLSGQYEANKKYSEQDQRIFDELKEDVRKVREMGDNDADLQAEFNEANQRVKKLKTIAIQKRSNLAKGLAKQIRIKTQIGVEGELLEKLEKAEIAYEKLSVILATGNGAKVGTKMSEENQKLRNAANKEMAQAQKELDDAINDYKLKYATSLSTTEQQLYDHYQQLQEDIKDLNEAIDAAGGTRVTKDRILKLRVQKAAMQKQINTYNALLVSPHMVTFEAIGNGEFKIQFVLGNGQVEDAGIVDEKTVQRIHGLGRDAWRSMITQTKSGNTVGAYKINRPALILNNKMYEAVKRNLGSYLHTSYAKHEDPELWKKQAKDLIGEAKWKASIDYLSDQMKNAKPNSIVKDKDSGLLYIKNAAGVMAPIHNLDDFRDMLIARNFPTNDIIQFDQVRNSDATEYYFSGVGQDKLYIFTNELGLTFTPSTIQTEDVLGDIISADRPGKNEGPGVAVGFAEGIFKKKSEIPAEIKILMGENTDARITVPLTFQYLAMANNRIQYEQALYQIPGIVSTVATPYHTEEVQFYSAPANEIVPPTGTQRKYYVTPEVKEWLFQVNNRSQFMDIAGALTGMVKFNMTVGSVSTQTRNFMGAHLQNMKAGRWTYFSKFGQAGSIIDQQHKDIQGVSKAAYVMAPVASIVQAASKYFSKLSDQESINLLDEVQEMGVLSGNIDIAIVKDMLKLNGLLEQQKQNRLSNIASQARIFGSLLGRIYSASDDFGRISAYLFERDRLMELRNKYPTQFNHTDKEIKEEAGRIVRRTIQTYREAPLLFQELSRFPLVASLIIYKPETLRVDFNIIMQGLEEYKQGREKGMPELARMGIGRMASVLFMYVSTSSLALTGLSSIITAGLALLKPDDDKEEPVRSWSIEEDRIIRSLLPDYQKNNVLIGWKANNQYNYYDISYTIPTSDIHTVVNAATNKDGGFVDAYVTAVRPYVETDILFHHLFNVAQNKDDFGNPITVKQDQLLGLKEFRKLDQGMANNLAVLNYLHKNLGPRLIAKELPTIYGAAVGLKKPNGEEMSLPVEFNNISFGVKGQSINIEKRIKSNLYKAYKDFQEADTPLIVAMNNANPVKATLMEKYELTEKNRIEHYEKLQELIAVARRMNIPDVTIFGRTEYTKGGVKKLTQEGMLFEAGIPGVMRLELMNNVFNPRISQETIDKYNQKIEEAVY
jgi:hypothetical protein